MTKSLDSQRLWDRQYTDGIGAKAWVAMAQEMNRSSKSPRVLAQIKKNALASARKIHQGGALNIHQTPPTTPPKSRPQGRPRPKQTAKKSRPHPPLEVVCAACFVPWPSPSEKHHPYCANIRYGWSWTVTKKTVFYDSEQTATIGAAVDVPCRKTAVVRKNNVRRGRE